VKTKRKEKPVWLNVSRLEEAADQLGTEKFGAFSLIVMHYALNGPLPNDPAQLATIARMTPDDWNLAQPDLIGFFTIDTDGRLRLRDEEQILRHHEPEC
jgi:uncharacterized protein YdaU (DUF1376 family)